MECQILGVAKSEIQITHGTKSRDKTIMVGGKLVGDGEESVDRIRDILESAAAEP